MSAHRFEQIMDKVGETVSILQSTEGSADQFGNVTKTWALETTETAILPSPTTKTFAEVFHLMSGRMEQRDRLAYFKDDSVITEDKRVVLASGEEYEITILDSPRIFGTPVMKVAILRRTLEQ